MDDTTPQQYRRDSNQRGFGSGGSNGNYDRGGGFKRKREDQPMDEGLAILGRLVSVGDRRKVVTQQLQKTLIEQTRTPPPQTNQAGSVEQQIKDTVRYLKRHTVTRTTQLSTKMEVYATIIGLLNVDDYNFVGGLLQLAASAASEAWQELDAAKATALLRLLAALVPVHVLASTSVFALLTDTIKAATDIATGSAATDDPTGRTWQPFTDAIVEAALLALPWGGVDLWPEVPLAAQEQLTKQMQAYIAARPRASAPALGPFFQPLDDDDLLATLDNDGPSFLPLLWSALEACGREGHWSQLPIPRPHVAVEQQLAVAESHDLPPLPVPIGVPGLPDAPLAERAAWLLEKLPARGVLRLLDTQATSGDRPLLARLLAEQYMLEVLQHWEDDRVECALRLARELPLEYNYAAQLCEVMFGQMLRTPLPSMRTVGYCTIMVDLCKLLDTFARSMSGCVKQLFARCATTYPDLQAQWSQWLAYHLTNFNFTWPWFRWAHVLESPVYDAQRHFVTMLLSNLVRLSYRARVAKDLPEDMHCLLPPEPVPNDAPPPEQDAAAALSAEVGRLARAKTPAPDMQAWLEGDEGQGVPLPARLGGVLRGLLATGSKSFTHMIVLLERYHGMLSSLAKDAGDEGQDAMLGAVLDVWCNAPQRATMAVDRLMALQLVSTQHAAGWVFEHSPGVRSVADHVAIELSHELLHCIIDKAVARTLDAAEDLAAAESAQQAAMDEGGDDLDAKRAELASRQAVQRDVLLTAARGFAELLSGDAASLLVDLQAVQAKPKEEGKQEEEGWSTEELQSHAAETWREATLARVQGMLRRYHVAVAPITEDVRGMFAGCNEQVQHAVGTMLEL